MDHYVKVGALLGVCAVALLVLGLPTRKEQKKATTTAQTHVETSQKQPTSEKTKDMDTMKAGTASANGKIRGSKYPGGSLSILFGTQSGTAEEFAEALAKEGRMQGFDAKTIDLEEYDASEQLPKETRVICVMSTYGEGDPTDNAIEFVKYLKNKRKELRENSLEGVQFAVFGLGNSQYEHFNAIGRLVDKQLAKWGAQRMFPYGEGDDDAAIDEDFDHWKKPLWSQLRQEFIGDTATTQNTGMQLDPSSDTSLEAFCSREGLSLDYKCVNVSEPVLKNGHTMPTGDVRIKASTKHYFTAKRAKVVVNRELRQSNVEESTIHIELDLKDTGITYNTADNLAILPENSSDIVERLAKCQGYDLSQWISVQPRTEGGDVPFPSPCTISTILTQFVAINSAPRKGPLRQLACFAMDSTERQHLEHLASIDGGNEYQTWIVDAHRSYVDLFEHFTSIQLPLAALIQLVPFMVPRYYTIASSSLQSAQRVHLAVRVVTYPLPDSRMFHGVCSSFLARLQPFSALTNKNDKLQKKQEPLTPKRAAPFQRKPWPTARIFVRASTFRLPKDPLVPIIMVGPGTGIAPMRAFLHEREQMQLNGITLGKALLFFGCRRRDEDFIYRDELEAFQSTGVLTSLHVAFSREQDRKVYVQHLLQQEGEMLYDLLANHGAYVYVCGATSMGNDVNSVFIQVCEKHGSLSVQKAQTFIKSLQQDRRYVQELWS